MSECIGLRVGDLVHSAMVPDAAEQLRALIRGEIERYQTERRYRRKPDGSVARILGTDTDITSLKEAEARLASEKEVLAVTLDSIADGVISTDASHNIRLMTLPPN